jgi:hypothetical protein
MNHCADDLAAMTALLGMPTTKADTINGDRLTFLKA